MPTHLLLLVVLLLILSNLSIVGAQIGAQPEGSRQVPSNNPHASPTSAITVNVCHGGTTMAVPPSALYAHLTHGDTLGACDTGILSGSPGAHGHGPSIHGNSATAGANGTGPGNAGSNGNGLGNPGPHANNNAGGNGPGNGGSDGNGLGNAGASGNGAGAGPFGHLGADKVAICHLPPGNPENAHTLVVGNASVKAHLDHGDSLGPCTGGQDGNQPPKAHIAKTCAGLSCAFDGSKSFDRDGVIVSYAWTFGHNDSNDTGVFTDYTYPANGTYTVTLNVTDDDGAWDVTSRNVNVRGDSEDGVNQGPTAAFTHTCTGLNCTFDGSGSMDPDGAIVNWTWTVNPTLHGVNPSHAFPAAGTYAVTLNVTDNEGATGEITKNVAVSTGSGGGGPTNGGGSGGGGGGGGSFVATGGPGGPLDAPPEAPPSEPPGPPGTFGPTGGPDAPPTPAPMGPPTFVDPGRVDTPRASLAGVVLFGMGLLVAVPWPPGLRPRHDLDDIHFRTPKKLHHRPAGRSFHTAEGGASEPHWPVDDLQPPRHAAAGVAVHDQPTWGSAFQI